MLLKEWRDFILGTKTDPIGFPARFDLSTGSSIVRREMIERANDRFEVMKADDTGGITIWTSQRVWSIRHEKSIELLISMPRNPSSVVAGEWRDFIISHDPQPVVSLDWRLDLSRGAGVIRRKWVEEFGDQFEVMELAENGGVTAWTRDRVWVVHKEGNFERFIFLPRNPPSDTPSQS